jgi:HD-like signal output (HDOD) protein
MLFLLEGELALFSGSKAMQRFRAGEPRARDPVFRLASPGLRAVSPGRASILRVPAGMVEQPGLPSRLPEKESFSYSEISLTDDENALLSDVYHRFQSHQAGLPECPAFVQGIFAALQNTTLDNHELANLLHADPVIAARVMQLANSPVYRLSEPVRTLKQAVRNLGLVTLRRHLLPEASDRLFHPQSPLIYHRLHELYRHSIETAACSYVIAGHKRRFQPERALLAGVLHDIGVIPILVLADRHPVFSRDARLLENAIRKLHGFIGGMLLQHWGFEQELVTVAEESDDWWRDAAPVADYCDVVLVAQLHSRLLGGQSVAGPPLNEVPAFHKLGLGKVDPRTGIRLLYEARAEIRKITHYLNPPGKGSALKGDLPVL